MLLNLTDVLKFYSSASQTFLCRGPVTSSAEAGRPYEINIYFKEVEVDGAYVQRLNFRSILVLFSSRLGHLYS